MPVEDLEGLGCELLVPTEINPGGFEEEHPPAVIIGDVYLIRGYVLEVCKLIIALEDRLEFFLDYRKVVFQFLGYRK